MKFVKSMAAVIMAAVTLASCQKEINKVSDLKAAAIEEQSLSSNNARDNDWNDSKKGWVYTLSNQTTGNSVLAYRRAADGTLTFDAGYATGGNGTGGGLGNQGAVVLDDDGKILLAVNAGSNTISSFKINSNGLNLKSTVSAGGMRPVSITQYDDLVFVLNAGGVNNISGFKLKENGMLEPIANSTRPLSAATTGPAQVSFVNEGRVLVVTEKATNKIITYTINEKGIPGYMQSITSSSATPFGFAVAENGNIFVSEAVGGAPGASVLSSYKVSKNGGISLISGSVGAGQSAACWVVLANEERHAYATNTASNNLSTFSLTGNGSISVAQSISATTPAGPIDAAITENSKFLYVLNGRGQSISVFSVNSNGGLTSKQVMMGIPVGATGLAAN